MFVCRHNCFRSRVAEEYMKSLTDKHTINSAGLIPSIHGPSPLQIEIAKEYGLEIGNRAKGLSSWLLGEQDLVINTADDVPTNLFNHPSYGINGGVREWTIPDISYGSNRREDSVNIIEDLIVRVKSLEEELR